MNRGPIAIVKVGGSLLDWPELPGRLTGFLEALRRGSPGLRPALLSGGGPFADALRRLDRIHHLGDDEAHRLAIRAMDLATEVLLRLVPGLRPVDRLADLDEDRPTEIPMLVPTPILGAIEAGRGDPLPCSWDVTSDSIAARIADSLRARSLVLLKSAPIAEGSTREEAAGLGLVDPFFPSASKGVARVEYVNLRESVPRPIELRVAPP